MSKHRNTFNTEIQKYKNRNTKEKKLSNFFANTAT